MAKGESGFGEFPADRTVACRACACTSLRIGFPWGLSTGGSLDEIVAAVVGRQSRERRTPQAWYRMLPALQQ